LTRRQPPETADVGALPQELAADVEARIGELLKKAVS
jgi:hypothetical protein